MEVIIGTLCVFLASLVNQVEASYCYISYTYIEGGYYSYCEHGCCDDECCSSPAWIIIVSVLGVATLVAIAITIWCCRRKRSQQGQVIANNGVVNQGVVNAGMPTYPMRGGQVLSVPAQAGHTYSQPGMPVNHAYAANPAPYSPNAASYPAYNQQTEAMKPPSYEQTMNETSANTMTYEGPSYGGSQNFAPPSDNTSTEPSAPEYS